MRTGVCVLIIIISAAAASAQADEPDSLLLKDGRFLVGTIVANDTLCVLVLTTANGESFRILYEDIKRINRLIPERSPLLSESCFKNKSRPSESPGGRYGEVRMSAVVGGDVSGVDISIVSGSRFGQYYTVGVGVGLGLLSKTTALPLYIMNRLALSRARSSASLSLNFGYTANISTPSGELAVSGLTLETIYGYVAAGDDASLFLGVGARLQQCKIPSGYWRGNISAGFASSAVFKFGIIFD